jgi:type VI secretion system (T6SS) effector TldE1-like protein
VGNVLVGAAVRSISVGIAALALGLALKSGLTSTAPAHAGLLVERPGVSVFGTIHPQLFAWRPPVGARIPENPVVRLASADAQITSDAIAEDEKLSGATASIPRASFYERFASAFGERFVHAKRAFPEPSHETIVLASAPAAQPDETRAQLRAAARRKLASLVADVPAPVTATASQPDEVRPPPRAAARRKLASLAVGEPATVTLPALEPAPKHQPRPADIGEELLSLPDGGRRTAVYDITAKTVYLPSGQRLEAHSGLGRNMDDPRSSRLKMRGVTPPNVYQLRMREALFHGVRAIRLVPVNESKMYGRDGMLAHTYMLGPNGQSNGCVSFANYSAFLNAFQKGEIDRLVVVERLATAPVARSGPGWIPQALKDLFKGSAAASRDG